MSAKKIALWLFVASVGVSAALGIVIVLAGSFSEIQERILFTTLTISAASICALAGGALWESRRRTFLATATVVLASVSAILTIIGIWAEIHTSQFWKFSISLSLLAVASAHACLLSLARLARRFSWARIVAFIAVYLLAGQFIYVIYMTPKGDVFVRVIGATSIIVAALTILTPLFHRLSRGDLDGSERPGFQPPTAINCPECGVPQSNSLTETTCGNCGCEFLVTILKSGRALTGEGHA